MPNTRTKITDLVQELRAKYPDVALPKDPTAEDYAKCGAATRAYRRELRARVRERFGLEGGTSESSD